MPQICTEHKHEWLHWSSRVSTLKMTIHILSVLDVQFDCKARLAFVGAKVCVWKRYILSLKRIVQQPQMIPEMFSHCVCCAVYKQLLEKERIVTHFDSPKHIPFINDWYVLDIIQPSCRWMSSVPGHPFSRSQHVPYALNSPYVGHICTHSFGGNFVHISHCCALQHNCGEKRHHHYHRSRLAPTIHSGFCC